MGPGVWKYYKYSLVLGQVVFVNLLVLILLKDRTFQNRLAAFSYQG